MIETSEIAYRLRILRQQHRLSMDGLVQRMNGALSKMAISKYERAQIRPTYESLCLLAKALRVKADYFTQPPLNMKLMGHRFQLDQMTDVERQAMQQIRDQIQIYVCTEQFADAKIHFTNPLRNATVRDYEAVERATQRLRRAWELGSQPIVSVYELLVQHGIRVIEFCAEQRHLDGLSFYVGDGLPFVCINTHSNTTVERKRFTALHELAHLLLHLNPMQAEEYHTIYPDSQLKAPDVERLAHRFAGSLLIPESVLRNRLGEHRTDVDVAELISLKNLYGISVAASIHRTADVGIMPYDLYRQWYGLHVLPNIMEEGWGHFPIPETADRQLLMQMRGENVVVREKKTNPRCCAGSS